MKMICAVLKQCCKIASDAKWNTGRWTADLQFDEGRRNKVNEIEVTVNINLNGEKVAGITTGEQAAETLQPGDVGREVTQEEEQRFAVASDLANVCEYLEDSEVIKIRLIVNKAQARKDRAEKGDEK